MWLMLMKSRKNNGLRNWTPLSSHWTTLSRNQSIRTCTINGRSSELLQNWWRSSKLHSLLCSSLNPPMSLLFLLLKRRRIYCFYQPFYVVFYSYQVVCETIDKFVLNSMLLSQGLGMPEKTFVVKNEGKYDALKPIPSFLAISWSFRPRTFVYIHIYICLGGEMWGKNDLKVRFKCLLIVMIKHELTKQCFTSIIVIF